LAQPDSERRHVSQLDQEDIEQFRETGWLVLHDVLTISPATLTTWVDEVARWIDGGPGLHYQEQSREGPRLCRSEDFTPFHAGLFQLLREGVVPQITSDLLGEPAVLYKEKINYKLPGGAGYSPHQDAPAYLFVERHISCMIPVDPSTRENGALEVVSGFHHEILLQDEKGCIDPSVVDQLDWQLVELNPGDVVWFHSKTPHRSGANRSVAPRRALYPTYNALSEGDLREQYYREKQEALAGNAHDPTRVNVSLIGDFEGIPL
jgi:hypothetical protein